MFGLSLHCYTKYVTAVILYYANIVRIIGIDCRAMTAYVSLYSCFHILNLV